MGALIPNPINHFFITNYEGNNKGQRVGKFLPFDDNGTIAKSCLFDKSSTGSLIRTPSSDGNKGVFTISLWYKPTTLNYGILFYASSSDDAWNSASSAGLFMEDFKLRFYSSGTSIFTTNRTFEDTSKFYHILVANDYSQSNNDKIKLYVDGDQITSFSPDGRSNVPENSIINTQIKHNIGGQTTTGTTNAFIDAYIAEFNFVDGAALTPSTFGLTDTSTGRWIPKTLTGISYGTNGFRMEFANTAGQTIGDDTSGNGNDFTVTNLVASDITTDSPTQNFPTLEGTGGTLSKGNLTLSTGNSERGHHNSTLKPSSGKYYAEFTCNSMGRSEVGVASTLLMPYGSNTQRLPTPPDGSIAGYMYYGYNGRVYYNSSNSYDVTYATYTTNDIISIALDLDNHTVEFFKTDYDSATSSYGSRVSQGTLTLSNGNYTFVVGDGASGYGGGWTANFGASAFRHSIPSGFVALQQDNLPSTSNEFPDFVWIKNRDSTDNNQWYDSTRGPLQMISPNSTAVETTTDDGLQKFLKGGFEIEDNVAINTNNESYVSWNWIANAGTTSANTDGSGATIASTIQANPTAGFSIVTYTGTGTAGSIEHGLSSAPEWIVVKKRTNDTQAWQVYHHKNTSEPETEKLTLNTTAATVDDNTTWNDQAPTSSVFYVGNGSGTNESTDTYVAYCWTGVPGYSKFGSFTGNGSADGTFVYTGFKPRLLIWKRTNSTNQWNIHDAERNPNNPVNQTLYVNNNTVGETAIITDFLANGFKLRSSTAGSSNNSGSTYVYMVFAEYPFFGADGITISTAR